MDSIEKVPKNLQDEAIANLSGVNVYDSSTLEKGEIFVAFLGRACRPKVLAVSRLPLVLHAYCVTCFVTKVQY